VERRDPRSQGRAELELLLTCGPGATVERREPRSQKRGIRAAADLWSWRHCGEKGPPVSREEGLELLLTNGPGTVKRRDPGLKGGLN
jgi:hypothetical protein